jgi:ribosomal protein L11 methyltransferase
MNRYTLRVPAADAELAMLRMLEWFPGGIEEQRDGDQVELSGFAERAPDPSLSESPVADGWADAWRDFHRPVREGRLWVGPPWSRPEPIAVVIDPGRAFGTGAHGSTRAALALLQELDPGRHSTSAAAPACFDRGAELGFARCRRSTSIRWPCRPRGSTPPATTSS